MKIIETLDSANQRGVEFYRWANIPINHKQVLVP